MKIQGQDFYSSILYIFLGRKNHTKFKNKEHKLRIFFHEVSNGIKPRYIFLHQLIYSLDSNNSQLEFQALPYLSLLYNFMILFCSKIHYFHQLNGHFDIYCFLFIKVCYIFCIVVILVLNSKFSICNNANKLKHHIIFIQLLRCL